MKVNATVSGVTNKDYIFRTATSRAADDVTTMNHANMTIPILDDTVLPKANLSVGILSTRTLNKQGNIDLLLRKISWYTWDVISLSKTHLPFTGAEKHSRGTLIFSGHTKG